MVDRKLRVFRMSDKGYATYTHHWYPLLVIDKDCGAFGTQAAECAVLVQSIRTTADRRGVVEVIDTG